MPVGRLIWDALVSTLSNDIHVTDHKYAVTTTAVDKRAKKSRHALHVIRVAGSKALVDEHVPVGDSATAETRHGYTHSQRETSLLKATDL